MAMLSASSAPDPRSRLKKIAFQLSIVLSAFLLFLVQPIIAKQILPWFGGSASVWTTCLFFFQLLLLLGYIYAHALIRYCPPRRQAAIHVALLALSLLSLPVIASPSWKVGESDPILRILLLLGTTVGLPYFLLSTTSPLLQAWYARGAATPYGLFAVSNAASLAGLLAYPLLLEPNWATSTLARLWSAGFVLFALACAATALLTARDAVAAPSAGPTSAPAPNLRQRILWVSLSALGSLALITVTSFIGQNVASMPLIWVLPLAIYLVTFILAFGRGNYQGWPVAGPALVFGVVMVTCFGFEDWLTNFAVSLPVYMAGLFFVCLYCHGRLAATKPDPSRLTGFYILVSLGGALGALIGSVLVPLVLKGDFELPLTLAAIAVAIAWAHRRDRPLSRIATGLLALVVVAVAMGQIVRAVREARLLTRNFYSALRIVDTTDVSTPYRTMEHGSVEHGTQYLDPARRREPLSYYSATSGVALALKRQRELAAGGPLAIGIIGLGAGALAAYGEPGDRFRFYELNPQVIELARSQFTYLADSRAEIGVALGDARLVLEAEASQSYDAIVVDAFSGDAIPVHLLTREAIGAYRRHLKPGGILLLHISNKFVDLGPAVARLALEEGLEARLVSDSPDGEHEDDDDSPLSGSDWIVLYADKGWLGPPKEAGDLAARGTPLVTPKPGRAWTDDFNNILSAVRLGGTDD